MRALIIPPSDTAKYPPGVRFVFLLLLSIWVFLVIAPEGGQVKDGQLNTFIFALTSILSLVLLIIGLLPWAKKDALEP